MCQVGNRVYVFGGSETSSSDILWIDVSLLLSKEPSLEVLKSFEWQTIVVQDYACQYFPLILAPIVDSKLLILSTDEVRYFFSVLDLAGFRVASHTK